MVISCIHILRMCLLPVDSSRALNRPSPERPIDWGSGRSDRPGGALPIQADSMFAYALDPPLMVNYGGLKQEVRGGSKKPWSLPNKPWVLETILPMDLMICRWWTWTWTVFPLICCELRPFYAPWKTRTICCCPSWCSRLTA